MAAPKGNLVTPVGFNPNGRPRALEVDSSDILKMTIGALSSISSQGIVLSNSSLPAGSSHLLSDAVPSGKIWIVSNLLIRYLGTTATKVYVLMALAGAFVVVFMQNSPSNGVAYDRQGWWVLQPGDYIRWSVDGATLNDSLYGYASVCTLNLNS